MERVKCCMCDNSPLIEKISMDKFPIRQPPSTEPYENDEYFDFKYGACIKCGSLQAMTLVSQDILYKEFHNGTTLSDTWYRHHSEFTDFIKVDSSDKIIEIGGTGTLKLPYSHVILNITESEGCIKGNCEDFDFSAYNVVVMSHVFEHLYEPVKFIRNCKAPHIFISQPVMVSSNVIPLNAEHTFFADDIDVQAVFERNNYRLKDIKYFEKHSIFFHFVYDETVIPRTDNERPGREELLIDNFNRRKNGIESFIIDNDYTYVMPSGHYGQYVYYYMDKTRLPRGFIDNDVNKIGKRNYGTPLFTYSPNKVTPKTIILHGGHYHREIKEQILNIYPDVNVIEYA